jgi:hypothetical protein
VKSDGEKSLADIFARIYRDKTWSEQGDGSGPGSTIEYTKTCRNILYNVIRKYEIKSMLDTACGSFLWMPLILTNVSDWFAARNETFQYHGLDIVASLVEKSRRKYSKQPGWRFSVVDFSQKDTQLPSGYDLVFSRDALMHLSYEKIFNSLIAFTQVADARYLLVSSYVTFGVNENIRDGDYFPLNLIKPPFNLTDYIEIFYEDKDSPVEFKKNLLLYDIPNYLKKIDLEGMKQHTLNKKCK